MQEENSRKKTSLKPRSTCNFKFFPSSCARRTSALSSSALPLIRFCCFRMDPRLRMREERAQAAAQSRPYPPQPSTSSYPSQPPPIQNIPPPPAGFRPPPGTSTPPVKPRLRFCVVCASNQNR